MILPRVAAALALCLTAALVQAQAFSSSSTPAVASTLPDDPAAAAAYGNRTSNTSGSYPRPFRALAIEARIGTGGIGFEVATPLASRMNLRAGAQFFGHTVNIASDGLQAIGDITLQNVAASVDIYPFRHSGFRISPGITIHNDNHVAGPLSVPGGQTFSLGDGDYTSDPTDPIHGFARIKFGNTVAPRLTVGFGNMLPRNGRHWSVPFEIGFQYISDPTVDISLGGSACDDTGCGSIDQGDGPQNLKQEIADLNSDLHPLRFFPIAAIGVSYRFGGGGRP